MPEVTARMPAFTTQRDVRLGVLENARDIGGYLGADGRRVRWGQVYRAASLHEVDLDDEQTATDWTALNLRTVVDLRRADERSKRGTVGAAVHPAGELHLPAMTTIPVPDFDLESQPEEYLACCYVAILDLGRDSVRRIFELLAEPEGLPLVMFCAAGKDRTGTMVALVLAALGVDDETICDDFELSGERIAAMVARRRASGTSRDPMIDQHPTILAAPRGAMRIFLNHLHTQTPGIEGYLASVGVAADTLVAVREALLERDPAPPEVDPRSPRHHQPRPRSTR